MSAHLSIGIREWLEPIEALGQDGGDFRDSVLFGIFLNTTYEKPKRLAGFGHGLVHFGRSYVSSTEYFYNSIRSRFPGMLPNMPNARVQADIAFLRMYDFFKTSQQDKHSTSLLKKYEELIQREEIKEIKILYDNNKIYKEIDGQLIAAGLFSRTGFHANTKWFENMIDPILNFDEDGHGELSYNSEWGSDVLNGWCLKFDMDEFRALIETEIYLYLQKVKIDKESTKHLQHECALVMQHLNFARTISKEKRTIDVQIQSLYQFILSDLPGYSRI